MVILTTRCNCHTVTSIASQGIHPIPWLHRHTYIHASYWVQMPAVTIEKARVATTGESQGSH